MAKPNKTAKKLKPNGKPSGNPDAKGLREIKVLDGTLQFDYIKSNFFRVIHVDGVTGGVVPTGKLIHMALFNERNAIPKSEMYKVEQGKLEPHPTGGRTAREGVVREVECDALLNLATAKAIHSWLTQIIGVAEAIAAIDPAKPKGDSQ